MNRKTDPHHWLHAQLPQWTDDGLISPANAESLRQRYPVKAEPDGRPGWMVTILGIFGGILISSGVILLFAHNWHELGREMRAAIAVAPLVVFQGFAGWTLWRRPGSVAWREGTAAGLTLSIGAAIALIAQTYQLGGDFGRFMFTWTVLAIPIVYLLRSGVAFWLSLAGAVLHAGYAGTQSGSGAGFFLLAGAVVPFAIWAHRQPEHPTLRVLCRHGLAIAFWSGVPFALDHDWDGVWLPLLSAAAGAMVLWDRPEAGERFALRRHPFALFGGLFLGGAMLVFSFAESWRDFDTVLGWPDRPEVPSWLLAGAGAIAWAAGLVRGFRLRAIWPLALGGAFPLLTFFGSLYFPGEGSDLVLMLATNAIGLAVGLLALRQAIREDRLALLNYGLALVGGLVLLRFFDADLGFVARGLGFIGLGIGFLAANFSFVRQRRSAADSISNA